MSTGVTLSFSCKVKSLSGTSCQARLQLLCDEFLAPVACLVYKSGQRRAFWQASTLHSVPPGRYPRIDALLPEEVEEDSYTFISGYRREVTDIDLLCPVIEHYGALLDGSIRKNDISGTFHLDCFVAARVALPSVPGEEDGWHFRSRLENRSEYSEIVRMLVTCSLLTSTLHVALVTDGVTFSPEYPRCSGNSVRWCQHEVTAAAEGNIETLVSHVDECLSGGADVSWEIDGQLSERLAAHARAALEARLGKVSS